MLIPPLPFNFPIKHVSSKHDGAVSKALTKAGGVKPMGKSPDLTKGHLMETLLYFGRRITNAEHLQGPVNCNQCSGTVVPGMTVCWSCSGGVVYLTSRSQSRGL